MVSNDNGIHYDDFYGYVRGNDCKTASFPSTNLEYSSYLLSMLRDLKKKYGNQKKYGLRARAPAPTSQ